MGDNGSGRNQHNTIRRTKQGGLSRIDQAEQERIQNLLDKGHSQAEVARLTGRHYNTIQRFTRSVREGQALQSEAEQALADFGMFRKRYMGRIATPWQVIAANRIVELLESPHDEYLVINCPPGSGKSTMLTDICTWVLCRNRATRILYGSAAQAPASDYTNRVMNDLTRPEPTRATTRELTMGLAVDGVTTLEKDFGRFKPANGARWTKEKFYVAQVGGQTVQEKEPSMVAFGRDSTFIGGRFDLCVWDDLVSEKTLRTTESREALVRWWNDTAESRVEPGGLNVLCGQRLDGDDLYRYAIDLPSGIDIEVFEDDFDTREQYTRKYTHIVYPAHDIEKCKGTHRDNPDHTLDAPYWPEGCLLDPKRLSWRKLSMLKANPMNNFETVYQQQDSDPTVALVQQDWINGGIGKDGAQYVGCYDFDRNLREFDPKIGPCWSVVTVDPSPTRYWCLAPETLVLTDAGEKQIAQLSTSDRVLTRNGYKPVLAVDRTGWRKVLKIGLSNGRTLQITPEHRVHSVDGWVPAGQLRLGTRLLSGNTGTLPAGPLASVGSQVVTGVGVASGAFGLEHLRGDVRGAMHVQGMALNREMRGVAADGVRTQVAHLNALSDLCSTKCKNSKSHAMHKAFAMELSTSTHGSVPVDLSPGPFPAFGYGVNVAPGQEVVSVYDNNVGLSIGNVAAPHATFGLRTDDHGPAFATVHVVSVTDGSYTDVYDIQVADEHEFYAEGTLVHNSIQHWLCHEDTQQMFLIDHVRKAMDAPSWLDWNHDTQSFSGVAQDMYDNSVDMGRPITHMIVEKNAAQQFMLQYDHMKRWQQKTGVLLVPHHTGTNKTDDKYGVQTLAPVWQAGRVRLPWKSSETRFATMKLTSEVTKWPNGATDDCVMAMWFVYYQWPRINPAGLGKVIQFRRPSWMVA